VKRQPAIAETDHRSDLPGSFPAAPDRFGGTAPPLEHAVCFTLASPSPIEIGCLSRVSILRWLTAQRRAVLPDTRKTGGIAPPAFLLQSTQVRLLEIPRHVDHQLC
jgi:hypothetical protein